MRIPLVFVQGMARSWSRISGVGEAELVPQARLSGPMPWVIAIMVAMTVIAAAAGLALRNAAQDAAAELQGGVTVQIVEAYPQARARQAEASVRLLRALPGISAVRLVPQDELNALIEPWLGLDVGGDAVPVPALIDVRMESGVTAQELTRIQQALAVAAPAARVDAQSSWLRPVFSAMESLQWLAITLVLLLAMALAAAVLLAARNALGINRGTIEIVHLLGGTDIQIARVFQRSIGVDAAAGGLVGLLLAIVVVLFLGRRFGSLGAGMVESGALGPQHWLILALIPLGAVILAVLTARFTVLRALRSML